MGKGEGAIHICRSEIRTPLPSIPRLEVIITYIRQLTRVHPLPTTRATLARRAGNPPPSVKLQVVPDTISRCADRAVMVRTPLLFYIVSALRLSLRAILRNEGNPYLRELNKYLSFFFPPSLVNRSNLSRVL